MTVPKIFTIRLARRLIYPVLLLLLPHAKAAELSGAGNFVFSDWPGPAIRVFYQIPEGAGPESRILFVIAGARRNAKTYCQHWVELSRQNGFIVLCPQATKDRFPSEYDYNAGGVVTPDGERRPEEKWLFSAIELIFDDFTQRFGSTRTQYSLYGHSAGGGFVHRYMLFKPDAPVAAAVAANPAFFTMPTNVPYPFGFQNTGLGQDDLKRWLSKKLTILLGELDTDPRTKPLSNSAAANLQGPNVYARGLKFFAAGLEAANITKVDMQWKLEVVENIGHKSEQMTPFALRHLFP